MAYVPVPKDLTQVKTKIVFNLTKRQLIFFSLAGMIGIPMYFLLRKPIGSEAATMLMVLVMLPCFLLAMFEKDGLPFEKVMGNIIRQKFQYPAIRPYRTENFYAVLELMIKEETLYGKASSSGDRAFRTGSRRKKEQKRKAGNKKGRKKTRENAS